ncbi:MAG: hypothetical protein JSR44_12490 [Spirochaetes bacterium]|nr:hypothetical protein [Spirochaetota bacterium]
MNPELLAILVCPRSKKKLALADTVVLDRVNSLIRAGACKDISGQSISESASEGLYQAETKIFYFVREHIPVLIYENALELK